MYRIIQLESVLYGIALHTTFFCIGLHCTKLFCTDFHCTTLFFVELYYTILFCTDLYCAVRTTVLYIRVLSSTELCPEFYCTTRLRTELYFHTINCILLHYTALHLTWTFIALYGPWWVGADVDWFPDLLYVMCILHLYLLIVYILRSRVVDVSH